MQVASRCADHKAALQFWALLSEQKVATRPGDVGAGRLSQSQGSFLNGDLRREWIHSGLTILCDVKSVTWMTLSTKNDFKGANITADISLPRLAASPFVPLRTGGLVGTYPFQITRAPQQHRLSSVRSLHLQVYRRAFQLVSPKSIDTTRVGVVDI